jgi:hypothetical protein
MQNEMRFWPEGLDVWMALAVVVGVCVVAQGWSHLIHLGRKLLYHLTLDPKWLSSDPRWRG